LATIEWCCGVLLGLPLAYAFAQLLRQLVLPVEFVVDPLGFVVMLAALLAIATVSSLIAAWRASHLRVADLLRYE
jgi:putative ABC transport system permease protein